MDKGFVAKASVRINAPVEKVWDALVNPAIIKEYMYGSDVDSDFKEGSPIFWRGVWEGKAYEEKGFIEKVVPNKLLQYSYFSPSYGLPDEPENYFHISNEITKDGNEVVLTLTQDGNKTEEIRDHSQQNWEMILQALKKLVE